MCVDVAGYCIERVDAGVIEGVDCDYFEEDVAQVVVEGILLEEFGEGLLDQFVLAVESFTGGFYGFCGWCLQG